MSDRRSSAARAVAPETPGATFRHDAPEERQPAHGLHSTAVRAPRLSPRPTLLGDLLGDRTWAYSPWRTEPGQAGGARRAAAGCHHAARLQVVPVRRYLVLASLGGAQVLRFGPEGSELIHRLALDLFGAVFG